MVRDRSGSDEEQRHGSHEDDDPIYAMAKTIYNLRFVFVVAWPALAVVMAPFSWLCVQNAAPIMKHSPPGTQTAAALSVFEYHFQDLATIRSEMVEMRCRFPCETAATDLTHGFVQQITDLLKRFGRDNPDANVQVTSYYTFSGQFTSNPMISHDHQAILLEWRWRMIPEMKAPAEQFLGSLHELVDQINDFQSRDGYDVSITGLVSLDHATKETLIEDILVHDISTIWMPLIILALALQSVRLLILALLPMPIEILVSIGSMYFVALKTKVLFYGLMMMILLCTSLSFDYALFMLTRYSEERGNGAEVREAILIVISQSGRVVVVSGSVLIISWGAMLALPNPFNTFCICSNSMILTCVLVQLTFTPSLLAILPFLGPPASEPRRSPSARPLQAYDSPRRLVLDSSEGFVRGAGPGGESPLAKARPHMRGIGYAMGRWLTLFPLNIVVPLLVYAAMMPLTLRMGENFTLSEFKFRMDHSYALTVPRTRKEWRTALRIQADFPNSVGILMPMMIIATNSLPPVSNRSLTAVQNLRVPSMPYTASTTPKPVEIGQDFYEANCRMVDHLIQATRGTAYNLTVDSFLSATFHGGDEDGVECAEYDLLNLVRTNYFSRNWFLPHTVKNLQMEWDRLVSTERHAMLTLVLPTMDPFSPDAFSLVKVIRSSLEQMTLEGKKGSAPIPGLTFMTFSPASVVMDLIDVTSVRLPAAFAGCVLVCLVLIALWFRVIFIPLKLLLTVVVPITWTYGAALYVYEDGVLNWTSFPGVMATGDAGIDWTVPMFTLTFIVGLALDYEIFLIERIREFREEGFGDRESIQLGLAATSGTITYAGLTLALTFIAMMLGSIPLTNQMGFIFVFSIVTDTFIVRTVLLPAMLSLVPCANYWPSRMPAPRYEWLTKGLDAPPEDAREFNSDVYWEEDDGLSESD